MGNYLHTKFNNLFNLSTAFFVILLSLSGCSPKVSDRILDGTKIHQVWKYDTGAPINQPPLRIGNTVVTVPSESPIIGLDVKTGDLLWEYDPGVRVWERAFTSDGTRLFVAMEDGKFAALDPENGGVLWEVELGINAHFTPSTAGGVVYVPTTFAGPGMVGDPNGKAKLFALSAKNGEILWEFQSENYALQTPFKRGDTVYLSGSFYDPKPVDEGGHARLYALNAADGLERWQFEFEDGFTKQVYATDNIVAYIAYQDFAVGVDAITGEMRWRKDTGNWVPTFSGEGNTIYYGSANTVVHAINMDTGETTWQYNIPEGTFNYVLGAPVRVVNELIFLTQQGEIMSLNADTGELRWEISTGIVGARTGLSVSGGWIFVGDAEGVVYGFTDK